MQSRELATPELDQEVERLAALRRYEILDTPPDGSFDRITAIAASLFSVPISIVSLVDVDRIWFKSHHGLDIEQIGRAPGLCASAILQDDPFILPNARADIRSLANPLVAGEFGLQFYIGVPLRTSDGFNLGTLCVIDREPRSVSERQVAQLQHLASVVMDQMELRLSARHAISELSEALAEKDAALRRTKMMAKEIEHRVKNSLQIISGLLSLQSRQLSNLEARAQLILAADRISTIARMHEHIYLSETIETTECKRYLQRLCDDLSRMLRASGRHDIAFEGVEAQFANERIVPLGLILHELLTNAAKHGAGQIGVTFERSGSGGYEMNVTDEGPGLPEGGDFKAASGLGMKIVWALVQQIGGTLVAGKNEQGKGARFTVLIPRA